MVISGRYRNQQVTLSVKPNCLTVSLEKEAEARVYSYDYTGRLWTALVENVSYRRGLDGKVVAKWQVGEGRERRWLASAEALQLQESARQIMSELYRAIQAGHLALNMEIPPQARLGFERLIAFDPQHAGEDVQRYYQVYRKIGILPPDQYMAVVLQATEGCSFNTCTFCDFYRDRPFRIKRPEEFKRHAEEVKAFIGDGMSLRRTIFLGDANALVTPMPRLVPLIEAVHQVYDVEQMGGLYAFLDGFSGEKKSPRDYELLARRGLKRVYLGFESGNENLLKFLKKPGKPEDAVHAVRAMKAGGVAVGIIILLGAGGQAYAQKHVEDTIRCINAMRLDADDLVYFSELVTSEGMEYVRAAYQANLKPLSPEERLAQGEAIEKGLEFSRKGGMPHISRYDIREFVY
ncbi:MAG: radical SAM protein [Omnitrophica WOR_2 bacterium]